jgi:SSS family solute:Na+ symporter
VLAARSRDTVKRSMAVLPAYSLMLGFLALLGFMAIAWKVQPVAGDGNTIVPVLYHAAFPNWFAGIAFGAIAIGALVPAAIMAIAAANTFTRDIYRPYLRRTASETEEALVSKIVSVIVKFGALGIIVGLKPSFAIEFQLIGGVIVIQVLPAVVLGLYTRWFHRWALVAGWIVGMGLSIYMLWITPNPAPGGSQHFGSSTFALSHWGLNTTAGIWTGIVGLVANVLVSAVLTPVLRRAPRGTDETNAADYHVEAPVPPLPVAAGQQ